MDLQGLQQLSTDLKKQARYIDDLVQTQENRGLKRDRKQEIAGAAKTRQPGTSNKFWKGYPLETTK